MNGARQRARPAAIARMGKAGWVIVSHSFLTNSKEEQTYGKNTRHHSGGACPPYSGARLVSRTQVPVLGRRSQTHGGWGPDECGLVAEPTEPEDPAPALLPVRSDGQGVQLCRGIQEPRPACRDQGPPCLDDDIAGLVRSE